MSEKWITSLMGDVVEVAAGQPAPQGSDQFTHCGPPFVRAGSLGYLVAGGDEDDLEHIDNEAARKFGLRLFPTGTVLFAKSGMSALNGFVHCLTKPCYVVSHLAALVPRSSLVPTYLAYWLRSNPPSRLIGNSAYPSIRLSQIAHLKIEHPRTVIEQRHIVAILDKANTIRRKRCETIRICDSLLNSFFFNTFGAPATNPHKWPEGTIGETTAFITSGSRGWAQYYAPSGSLFIRIQNLRKGFLDLSDVAYVNAPNSAEALRTRVQPGDVLLSITADLGRTAVVPDNIGEAYISQHIAILRFRSLNPYYVSHFLMTPAGQQQFARLNKSAVKAGLSFGDIRSVKMPIPPPQLQERFAAFVAKQQLGLRRLELAKIEADLLFVSLSQRAFHGNL